MGRVATLLFCCWLVSVFWVMTAARRHSMATPATAPADPIGPEPRAKDRKPNIVLILTDDQDVELGSLNFMPRTLRLMREGGAEFRHAYVTTPMCCPSRSSLLTGMYVHNHEVYTNNDNCSSPRWQASHESRSFATYLSNAGYRTGYFGKYLNKYNGSYIPAGWREWGGLIMNSRYYNYSINLNGKRIKHGADYHKDYYPDLIANDSVTFLRQSKQYFSRKPVMLVLSFPAPHGPEDSAPQFSHLFFNVTTHHTPAYDFAPNPDKQWILKVTDRMRPIHRQFTDLLMTKRLQTLQSVDEAVERIHAELKALGELDNTYVIYTSDHGYHLGQFGLVKGKSFPFEFDVRVPFLVRGPGVQPGTLIDDIVLNLDLAPTFLDIAGVETPSHMDGRSILPLLHRGPNHKGSRRRTRWPDTFLIESSGRRETPESIAAEAKRLARLKEMTPSASPPTPSLATAASSDTTSTETNDENDDEEEPEDEEEEEERQQALDIASGSLLPTNNTPDAVFQQQELSVSLDSIPVLSQPDLQSDNRVVPSVNSGASSLTSRMARIAAECRRPGSRGPCKPGQRWECRRDGARWRRHKCKHVAPINSVNYSYGIRDRDGQCQCSKVRNLETSTPALLHHRPNHKFLRYPGSVNKPLNRNENLQKMLLIRAHQQAGQRARIRREATLESRMQDLLTDLEAELHGLQSIGGVQGCKLFPSGNVNCTNAVYSDPKAWRSSRDFVEGRIRILRTKLEELKEIRRHLRSRRPTNVHSYDSSIESHDGENIGYQSPKHNIHHQRHRGRFNDSWFEDYDENSTGFHRQNRLNSSDLFDEISNSHDPTLAGQQCICENEPKDEKELAKEARRKLKEERLKKKERKMRKKAKMEKECLSEKMNCFNHDNDHWKTAPLWTEGPFCFCMNANNNTYSCLRTINVTHNFLYCEFVTGTVTFYNLRIDPYEQWNRVNMLTKDELVFLSAQLAQLKACKGAKQCTVGAQNLPAHGSSTNPSITGVDNLALDSSNLQTNHNKKQSGHVVRHGRRNGPVNKDVDFDNSKGPPLQHVKAPRQTPKPFGRPKRGPKSTTPSPTPITSSSKNQHHRHDISHFPK